VIVERLELVIGARELIARCIEPMDGLADPNGEDRIMLFATVRSRQSGRFGCFCSALGCSARKAALPLQKKVAITTVGSRIDR
jgi:hypothetical protein